MAYLCADCHGQITSINTLTPKMIGGYLNDNKGKIKIRNHLFKRFLSHRKDLSVKAKRKLFIKQHIPWKTVGKLGRAQMVGKNY